MATEQRVGFTGQGEQIVVEVPKASREPIPRLDSQQRAHVRALIAREHVGDETEDQALARLIAKEQANLVRYRGEGVEPLVEIRLRNLRRYQREVEEQS